MKLGKQPAKQDGRDLKLAHYVDTAVLPKLPSRFGWGSAFPNWGTYGNDVYGDCVPASRAHIIRLQTKIGAPATATFNTKTVLENYTEVTGFDPNDPSSDQGTDMRDMLKYQQKTGFVDAKGVRHKIGAYFKLTTGDLHELLLATFLTGGTAMGFEFPASAMDQFHAGEIWDYVPGSPIEGGHEVCVVGSMSASSRGTAVSWGKRQEFTTSFYSHHNDESWAWISEEVLNAGGTFRGLDITRINADLASL